MTKFIRIENIKDGFRPASAVMINVENIAVVHIFDSGRCRIEMRHNPEDWYECEYNDDIANCLY